MAAEMETVNPWERSALRLERKQRATEGGIYSMGNIGKQNLLSTRELALESDNIIVGLRCYRKEHTKSYRPENKAIDFFMRDLIRILSEGGPPVSGACAQGVELLAWRKIVQ